MPLDSKIIQKKIEVGLSRAGIKMTLKVREKGAYNPSTGEVIPVNRLYDITGIIVDITTQDAQALKTTFTETKKIIFNANISVAPKVSDQIIALGKKYIITEVFKTVPIAGEPLMFQVIVKI